MYLNIYNYNPIHRSLLSQFKENKLNTFFLVVKPWFSMVCVCVRSRKCQFWIWDPWLQNKLGIGPTKNTHTHTLFCVFQDGPISDESRCCDASGWNFQETQNVPSSGVRVKSLFPNMKWTEWLFALDLFIFGAIWWYLILGERDFSILKSLCIYHFTEHAGWIWPGT